MIYLEIIKKIREVEADGTKEVTQVIADRNTREQVAEEIGGVGSYFRICLRGIPIIESRIVQGYTVLWNERKKDPLDLHRLQNAWNDETSTEIKILKSRIRSLEDKWDDFLHRMYHKQ